MTDSNPISRFLNWLREGYPHGVPEADACAITYVLKRHLNEEDRRAIAAQILTEQGKERTTAVSDEEVCAFIEKLEMQTPEPEDIERIQALLQQGVL